MKKLLIILVFQPLVLTVTHARDWSTTSVYGEDGRLDLFEVTDPNLLKLSRAAFLVTWANSLTLGENGQFQLAHRSLAEEFGVCTSDKYAEQTSAGFCSGFLVGPDTAVTAGHCITDEKQCADTRFVFDYAIEKSGGLPTTQFSQMQIYSCSHIIRRLYSNEDYAVIKLDRVVEGREPLKMNLLESVSEGQNLLMVGHPSGLPLKITLGGKVRRNTSLGYFVTTLDAFGGNSGSAVLDVNTLNVLGILVRGENDYITKDGDQCLIPFVCEEDGCRGEDVTHLSRAFPDGASALE